MEEGRGPRVPRPRGPQGPKDRDISKSHSNTSLTLKKVHLVINIKNLINTCTLQKNYLYIFFLTLLFCIQSIAFVKFDSILTETEND